MVGRNCDEVVPEKDNIEELKIMGLYHTQLNRGILYY